ncbi:prephenate dehydratase [Amphritea japonica]|uniref:Bifunctional chorismate mutase/prephenate dehydratase n=1 Tax=Amphritea japonica ATCC BAA-1530 TaxID=1278309 RepID=A0A7R6PKW8_9GAMM|nr:prephenate dehydratase [Amphritea japonica]BBB25378.1 chorismate mutase/prephenate dehydratase [Amphritea japonica ATCC BAA-1530]
MSDQEKELKVLRDQIDSIDKQIHQLLNDRARCAQQVAEVKEKHQGPQDAVFYRPEREAQVLRRVMARNEGPLADKEVARLFREVMSVCLALEQPMHVAFLGPEGNFTQQAASKHFGHSAHCIPFSNSDEVFREVEAGGAHYGVVPIENSSEGMVGHTLDLFKRFQLTICGEVKLNIHHHLLRAGVEGLDGITHIYSPQQTLSQCRSWLDNHFLSAERVPVSSNSEAARMALQQGPGAAAIASELAADLYQLNIVSKNIDDQSDNSTRYLIIGDQIVGESGQDKTSILVTVRDKAGALYELLEHFHKHEISLTGIETRPASTESSHSVFYIDFQGHSANSHIQKVLQELESDSVELKILGSYPVAVL